MPHAHILRLFGIHQHFHCYLPRHDYLAGSSSPIVDVLSKYLGLSWSKIADLLAPYLPMCHQIWTPTPQVDDAVIAALLKKRQQPEYMLVVSPTPIQLEPLFSVPTPTLDWTLTPLSKPPRTKYQTYKTSHDEFIPENLSPIAIPLGLKHLKVTYGQLSRRPLVWGPC